MAGNEVDEMKMNGKVRNAKKKKRDQKKKLTKNYKERKDIERE